MKPLVAILGTLLTLSLVAFTPSISVTTPDDELNQDGDCSLREAIQAINLAQPVDGCAPGEGPATILLPAGTYSLTLAGPNEEENATGDLDIRSSLTIAGAGSGKTILNGNQLDRVLHIHPGASITIRGLEIRGGQTPAGTGSWGAPGGAGGAIYNSGALTVTDTLVQGNGTGEGGISLFGGRGGAGGAGGGLYNVGTLLIEHSILRGNHTGRGGGADNGGEGGAGGALFNQGTLTMTDSTLVGNRTGDGREALFRGGAGGDGGGLFSDSDVPVTIHNTVIRENVTGLGGRGSTIQDGVAGAGGGLYLVSGGGTIINTVVLANQSNSRGSGLILRGGEARLLSLTIARNSGGEGVGLLNAGDAFELPTVVGITNTIVVAQSTGILGTGGSTTRMDGILWFDNKGNYSGSGSITATNEYTGSPDFAADGFHLTASSWAIDRGVAGGSAADIDAEPRVRLPDLGADEFQGVPISPTPSPTPTTAPSPTLTPSATSEPSLYLPLVRR